jgi:hypothetical protein
MAKTILKKNDLEADTYTKIFEKRFSNNIYIDMSFQKEKSQSHLLQVCLPPPPCLIPSNFVVLVSFHRFWTPLCWRWILDLALWKLQIYQWVNESLVHCSLFYATVFISNVAYVSIVVDGWKLIIITLNQKIICNIAQLHQKTRNKYDSSR